MLNLNFLAGRTIHSVQAEIPPCRLVQSCFLSLALCAVCVVGTAIGQETVQIEATKEVVQESGPEPLISDPWIKQEADFLRQLQGHAIQYDRAIWGDEVWAHWGNHPTKYSSWTSHSNRLIPVYGWGLNFESLQGENSLYRDAARLEKLFGTLPAKTRNPKADYFDQTQIYQLQKQALASGKKNVILMVFDGMDWQTTRAAAIYKNKAIQYQRGRGTGLAFLDYGRGNENIEQGFGFMVTTPHDDSTKVDVDSQLVSQLSVVQGGYAADFGGATPWSRQASARYLMGGQKDCKHAYTDSAASATSMTAGIKTYSGAINVTPFGGQVTPIAHDFQKSGYSVGVVTNVSLSHATPASAYGNNVTRDDYQDLTRDMLGLKSASHRVKPLSGLDVLIGAGWGEDRDDDRVNQGFNFIPGNRYLSKLDLKDADVNTGGKYVVAQRTPGKKGRDVLFSGARQASNEGHRFLGFFGAMRAHLPYETASRDFNPTRGEANVDVYTSDDVTENPTLADMVEAALVVLGGNAGGDTKTRAKPSSNTKEETKGVRNAKVAKKKSNPKSKKGFWLMVEAGDVDWGNHNNNIDDAIGAVLSGERAFEAITNWVEKNSSWEETVLIVTADHGHMLVLDHPEALTGIKPPKPSRVYPTKLEQKKAAEASK